MNSECKTKFIRLAYCHIKKKTILSQDENDALIWATTSDEKINVIIGFEIDRFCEEGNIWNLELLRFPSVYLCYDKDERKAMEGMCDIEYINGIVGEEFFEVKKSEHIFNMNQIDDIIELYQNVFDKEENY